MSGALVITVRGPLGEELGLNSRAGFMAKGNATRHARELWEIAGDEAMRVAGVGTASRVRLTYIAYLCRRKPPRSSPDFYQSRTGYRPKDNDNLIGAMKPAQDGLVDAGLVSDDTADRVLLGDHAIHWIYEFADERVEVHVERLEGDPA